MNNELNLQAKDGELYLPTLARIIETKDFSAKEKFLRLELLHGKSLGSVPGQFVMVSMLGIGEAPISISSPPSLDNKFDLCFRAVGDVTNKLHQLNVGDTIYVRGPFGHGYEEKEMRHLQGKQLIFIAGGMGYAPLRSLINKVIAECYNYEKIYIVYGHKNPEETLYHAEIKSLAEMGGNVCFLETVDKADASWKGNVGVITTLIPRINVDSAKTVAITCGPPIMYKFVLRFLFEKRIAKENIYIHFERRMKCGIGKCGHCQMGGVYVCQKGPVFNYTDIENNEEAL